MRRQISRLALPLLALALTAAGRRMGPATRPPARRSGDSSTACSASIGSRPSRPARPGFTQPQELVDDPAAGRVDGAGAAMSQDGRAGAAGLLQGVGEDRQ